MAEPAQSETWTATGGEPLRLDNVDHVLIWPRPASLRARAKVAWQLLRGDDSAVQAGINFYRDGVEYGVAIVGVTVKNDG